jgi:hypothetical protein
MPRKKEEGEHFLDITVSLPYRFIWYNGEKYRFVDDHSVLQGVWHTKGYSAKDEYENKKDYKDYILILLTEKDGELQEVDKWTTRTAVMFPYGTYISFGGEDDFEHKNWHDLEVDTLDKQYSTREFLHNYYTEKRKKNLQKKQENDYLVVFKFPAYASGEKKLEKKIKETAKELGEKIPEEIIIKNPTEADREKLQDKINNHMRSIELLYQSSELLRLRS